MKIYTPKGVVVVVTILDTTELVVAVKVVMLFLFHIVFQKYYFLCSKKVLIVFLSKS